MKKFLIKVLPYFAAVVLLLGFLGSFADGNTDDNYMHFAVEKPENIIMGDSRGSQSVIPSILNKKLNKKFDNFSLNIIQSPYGEVYFKALQRKIAPDTKNGIFILTVDPWNLSLNKEVTKINDFPEEHSPLNNMYSYDSSPNYEYLLRNYSRSWFKLYTERAEIGRSSTFLHEDGWMEVSVDMSKDSANHRKEKKIIFYKDFAKSQKLSSDRLNAFNKIIEYLKDKGTVYIVRIPAAGEIMKIESDKFPQFSTLMKDIATKQKVKFFDFSEKYDDYLYTDGNHMYKESGKIFTAQIADSIRINK